MDLLSLFSFVISNPLRSATITAFSASIGVLVHLFVLRERALNYRAKKIEPLVRLLNESNFEAGLMKGARTLRAELVFHQVLGWRYSGDEIRFALKHRNPFDVLFNLRYARQYAQLSPEGEIVATETIRPKAKESESSPAARLNKKMVQFDRAIPITVAFCIGIGLLLTSGGQKSKLEVSDKTLGFFYFGISVVLPVLWFYLSRAYLCAITLLDPKTLHLLKDMPDEMASDTTGSVENEDMKNGVLQKTKTKPGKAMPGDDPLPAALKPRRSRRSQPTPDDNEPAS